MILQIHCNKENRQNNFAVINLYLTHINREPLLNKCRNTL